MIYRNLILVLLAFIFVYMLPGCRSSQHKISLPSQEYDLNYPAKLNLAEALSEISGISFYPKDSSVFAISDESGYLYKIHLHKRFITEQWRFDKKRDYEDVVQHDSSFYVLESNGNIEKLNFARRGDTVSTRRTIFP